MYRKAQRGEALEFVKYAARHDGNDCLEWPFGAPGDRGSVTVDGRNMTAARAVLEAAKGPPPSDKHQCAHAPVVCNNIRCVNPAHLRWATPAENSSDRVLDGSLAQGSACGSPLSETDVLAIRADNRPLEQIAGDYPVSAATISRIKNRKTWRHI